MKSSRRLSVRIGERHCRSFALGQHSVGWKGRITVQERLTQADTWLASFLDVPILCTTHTDKLIQIPDTTIFDFCSFSIGRRRLDRKTRQFFNFVNCIETNESSRKNESNTGSS